MTTPPSAGNPVAVGPYKRIVGVNWTVVHPIEYIVMDTLFYEPDTGTHGIELFDSSGNPGNVIDGMIPDLHSGFGSGRTGSYVLDRSDGYTRDLELVAIYNSLGEVPAGVFFDYAKFSGSLTPGYPISFSAEGMVYNNIIVERTPGAGAFGPVIIELADSGNAVELPGEAGITYSNYFKDGGATLTFSGVFPDGPLQYYSNAGGAVPSSKSVPVPYNSETLYETTPEVVSSQSFGLSSVSYDGVNFDVIGWNSSGAYADGYTSWPVYFRVRFLCKRRAETSA